MTTERNEIRPSTTTNPAGAVDQDQIKKLTIAAEPALVPPTETVREHALDNDDTWLQILTALKSKYKVDITYGDTGRILQERLGSKFAPRALAEDNDFRIFHIEQLLAESCDLLDRCRATRQEWFDLATRAFQVMLELGEFWRLDEVHIDEAKSGFYTLPYSKKSAELSAETAFADYQASALANLDRLQAVNIDSGEEAKQQGAIQLSGWVGAGPYTLEEWNKGAVQYTWNGTPKSKTDHSFDASVQQSWYASRNFAYTLYAQQRSAAALLSSSRERIVGLAKETEWHRQDVNFRMRRTEIARDTIKLKGKALIETDGPINYIERMGEIQAVFQRDFRGAIARLKKVSDGMNQILGYDKALPSSGADIYEWVAVDLWAREAQDFLARFSNLDQNYVLPISVKSQVPAAEWKAGLKTGQWAFVLPKETFPGQKHVRLRGLNCFVEAEAGLLMTVEAKLPDKADYYHFQKADPISVDQSVLPVSRVARAQTRVAIREPDTTGAMAWHNASPLGKWQVTVKPTLRTETDLDSLKDVVLDLHLAVRSG